MPRVGDAPLVHDMHKCLLLVSLLQGMHIRVRHVLFMQFVITTVIPQHCLVSAVSLLVAQDRQTKLKFCTELVTSNA